LEKAQERIEAEQNILNDELSIQLEQTESIAKEMARLKVCLLLRSLNSLPLLQALLYGKFGKSINLEKD